MPTLHLMSWEELSSYFQHTQTWSSIVLTSILLGFLFSVVAIVRRGRNLSLVAMVLGLLPVFIGFLDQFRRAVFGLFLRSEFLDAHPSSFLAGFYIIFFPILLAAAGSFLLTLLNTIAIARSRPTPPKHGAPHAT